MDVLQALRTLRWKEQMPLWISISSSVHVTLCVCAFLATHVYVTLKIFWWKFKGALRRCIFPKEQQKKIQNIVLSLFSPTCAHFDKKINHMCLYNRTKVKIKIRLLLTGFITHKNNAQYLGLSPNMEHVENNRCEMKRRGFSLTRASDLAAHLAFIFNHS